MEAARTVSARARARVRARLPRLIATTGSVLRPAPSASYRPSSATRPRPRIILPTIAQPSHARLLHLHRSLGTANNPCFECTSSYGPQKGDRIVIAMSGGVDSSVTALLLSQASQFELEAVFMRNWNELDEIGSMEPGSGGSSGCSWQRDWEDVQSVCRHLGNIPVSMVDLSRQYWTQVFEPALDDWRQGTTPNPDVSCNREIKFGALMDRVLPSTSSTPKRGPKSWLATGHYASVSWTEIDARPRPMLMRARDRTKDQTYYLSSVTEDRLAHAHFPLAHLLKSQVRELARRFDLPTATRKESMGICFIGTRGSDGKTISHTQGFSSFLNGYIASPPGDIVDAETSTILSTHQGLHTLTVGQGARIPSASSKYYVAKKDVHNNRILVVQGKRHPMLMCTRLYVANVEWIWREEPVELAEGGEGRVRLLAQVRHRQVESVCTVSRAEGAGGGYVVQFEEPVLAVAPGQVLGLWKGQWCLGSAVIQSVETVYDDQLHHDLPKQHLVSHPAHPHM